MSKVKTRFFVLSDTHGFDLPREYTINQPVDVVIHCGDLTTESKIDEFKSAIRLLRQIDAPLKLIIAGNHDFTLDTPTLQKKVAEAFPPLDPVLVHQEYGCCGDVRRLFQEDSSLTLLDEGTHHFTLQNGASLTVYASPYTPSLGDWGFQYHPDKGHRFDIHNADVVMTHGPPRGILDFADSGQRAGCPSLFTAVARAKPLMHCFGHIHEGWGAKVATWRSKMSEKPSHLTDIDNGKSRVIEKLPNAKSMGLKGCYLTGDGVESPISIISGEQTLFINAAIEGTAEYPVQPPWIVDIELPSGLRT